MNNVSNSTRRKRRRLATTAALLTAVFLSSSLSIGLPANALAAGGSAPLATGVSLEPAPEAATSSPEPESQSLDTSTIIGYWNGDVSDLTDVQRSEMAEAGIDLGGEIASAPPTPVPDELLAEAGECAIPLGEDVVEGLTACAKDADGGAASMRTMSAGTLKSGDGADAHDSALTSVQPMSEPPTDVGVVPNSPCVVMVWERIVSSRSEACFGFDRTLSLVDSRTMQVVGTYLLSMVTKTTTMMTQKMQVNNDTSFRVQYATGYAIGRSPQFVGDYQCNVADCVDGTAGFNSTVDVNWRTATGGSRLEFAQSATPRELSENWAFTVTVPGAIMSETITTMALKPRCDNNAVYNTGRGCVYPEFIPAVTIKTTGATAGAGQHIAAAQAYGLPTRLTRTTPSQATANRKLSCPSSSSLPRPQNWQCDEYPFASAVEGGSRNVLIMAGCTWAQRTPSPTEKIVSICLIPQTHNETAGLQVLTFYRNNRIIPGDQFDVRTQ